MKYLESKTDSIEESILKMWEKAAKQAEDIRKKYKGKEQKAVDRIIMRDGVDSVQKTHDKNPKKFDAMVKRMSKSIKEEKQAEDIRKKYKGKEQKAVDMLIMRDGVDSVQKTHDKNPKKFDAMVKRMSKSIKEDNTNDKSDDGEGLDKVQPKAVKKKFKDRKDKDIDNDGDVDDTDKYLHKRRKAISKAISKENFDVGTPENTKSKLAVTPGQSADDWEQQVETIQKKNASMRERLAKIWDMDEGKNPFAEKAHKDKEEKNPKKAMTGEPVTKIEVDPKINDK